MSESLAELYANGVREKNNRLLKELKNETRQDALQRLHDSVMTLETYVADLKELVGELEGIDKDKIPEPKFMGGRRKTLIEKLESAIPMGYWCHNGARKDWCEYFRVINGGWFCSLLDDFVTHKECGINENS